MIPKGLLARGDNWWRRRALPPGPQRLFRNAFIAIAGKPALARWVKIAIIAKANSVNSFAYVSSGFADPKNSGAYLRYKGEVEEGLKKLNFTKLGIVRPSFLLGNRKEKRFGEKIGIFFFKLLSPLF